MGLGVDQSGRLLSGKCVVLEPGGALLQQVGANTVGLLFKAALKSINPMIESVWRFTTAITNPMLRPLRRLIPPIAGVDLSVLVLVLVLALLRDSVLPWFVYGVLV